MDYEEWQEEWEEPVRAIATEAMRLADPGHGIDHVSRVVQNVLRIGPIESADPIVALPAAWLHDCILLPKNSAERSQASRLAASHAIRLLESCSYPSHALPAIQHAIEAHSFSAGIPCATKEARVVQDADRLEALGAIGIARCLQTGAVLGQRLYHPDSPFPFDRPSDDRMQSIDHFFAKLFRLPATMQTEAGRIEAQRRTSIMIDFLRALCTELGGESLGLQPRLDELIHQTMQIEPKV